MLRLWRAAFIVLLGAACGLGWNAWSGVGIDLRANALVRPGDEEISPAETKARMEKGALCLDARPEAFYEMSHIPGSLPLPEEDFDHAFAKLEPQLRSSLDVIVYCSGFGCDASHIVARKLKEKGIPAVVLKEGWPAWTEAGYPQTKGKQP